MNKKYICVCCKQEIDFVNITIYNNKYYCLDCIENKVSFANKNTYVFADKKNKKEEE